MLSMATRRIIGRLAIPYPGPPNCQPCDGHGYAGPGDGQEAADGGNKPILRRCHVLSLYQTKEQENGQTQQAHERPHDAQDSGGYTPDGIRVGPADRASIWLWIGLRFFHDLSKRGLGGARCATFATEDIFFEEDSAAVGALGWPGHVSPFSMGSMLEFGRR